jgi:hypothetical protein
MAFRCLEVALTFLVDASGTKAVLGAHLPSRRIEMTAVTGAGAACGSLPGSVSADRACIWRLSGWLPSANDLHRFHWHAQPMKPWMMALSDR